MRRRTKDTSDTSPGQLQVPLACKLMASSNTTRKHSCSGINTSFQTHNTQDFSAQYFEVNLPVFFEATLSILRHLYSRGSTQAALAQDSQNQDSLGELWDYFPSYCMVALRKCWLLTGENLPIQVAA